MPQELKFIDMLKMPHVLSTAEYLTFLKIAHENSRVMEEDEEKVLIAVAYCPGLLSHLGWSHGRLVERFKGHVPCDGLFGATACGSCPLLNWYLKEIEECPEPID